MSEPNKLDPTPGLPDDTLISDVEFPARVRKVLTAVGLKTVGEVRETSDDLLLSSQDLGRPLSPVFVRPWAYRRLTASGPRAKIQLNLRQLPSPHGRLMRLIFLISRLSRRCFSRETEILGAGKEMSQISFVVLIALGLALTGYYGLAAWRASVADRTEITGTVFSTNR